MIVLAEHWQSVAEMLVGKMLNGVAEGLILALCGWLLLHTMRRRNSSTRFAVWLATLAAVVALPVIHGAFASGNPASTAHFAFRMPVSWAIGIFLVWTVIAGAGLAKIVFGFWQLHMLRRNCLLLNAADLQVDLSTMPATNRFHRRVRICASDKVRVPAAIGFFRPAIVIPTWARKELTPSELNAVVLHELAHLRRWDDWTNLAQKIVSAILFFHPAVWWIGHGLAREREMACDDFVLAATSDHRGYAQCLVSVAEKSFLRGGLALAQAMAGRMQLTAQRVGRILQGARSTGKPASTKVWKPAVALVTAVSAVCLVSLAHEPHLVAFENGNSEETAIAKTAPHLNANVIPAAYTARNENGVPPSKTRAAVTKHIAVVERNAVVSASVAANVQHPPVHMVDANARGSVHAIGSHTVLVIMRSDQIDAYGRIWSVSVWQLTVYRPQSSVREIRKRVSPKST
jgi:beta-lactamase regulating signal transducer with metallopeptidase domain